MQLGGVYVQVVGITWLLWFLFLTIHMLLSYYRTLYSTSCFSDPKLKFLTQSEISKISNSEISVSLPTFWAYPQVNFCFYYHSRHIQCKLGSFITETYIFLLVTEGRNSNGICKSEVSSLKVKKLSKVIKKSGSFWLCRASLIAQLVKNLLAMQETLVWFLGLGGSAEERIGYPLQYSWASLVAQLVKNLPALWEIWVQFLGWVDPLEKGKATHSSILAWRISCTVYLVHRLVKSQTRLSDFHTHTLTLTLYVLTP